MDQGNSKAGIPRDFRLVWVYELLRQMQLMGLERAVGPLQWLVLVEVVLHLVEQNQQS